LKQPIQRSANQTANQKRNRQPLKKDWIEEYHEYSEDLRYYGGTSWQIPSAVLVVDFVILGLAYSNTALPNQTVRSGVLLFGGLYSIILTINFAKFAYRAKVRRKSIQEIERMHPGLRGRYLHDEPWFVRYAQLSLPMGLLLVAVSGFLLYLAYFE